MPDDLYNDEELPLMRCPYNPTHIIRKYRFPSHVYRCQKKYPDVNLNRCLHNYTHMYKPEDTLKHLEICPNRTSLEERRYKGNEYVKDNTTHIWEEDMKYANGLDGVFQVIEPINRRTYASSKNDESKCSDPVLDKNKKLLEFKKCLCETKGTTSRIEQLGSEISENTVLEEDEILQPLPLPETKSKAFFLQRNILTEEKKEVATKSTNDNVKPVRKVNSTYFGLDTHDEAADFIAPEIMYKRLLVDSVVPP